ncbi:hypothetical protein [Bradyrhizobium sp. SYSU BS000235]|uniref:hypothetical protein n=1 Tax=Bradyrhizobium sp. SYSU BS000235 TaxID=3411332 RepID=UPI003C77B2BB
MAKVDLDRELAVTQRRRKELGISLRLDHALRVMAHEAKSVSAWLEEPSGTEQRTVSPSTWKLSTEPDLNEAWMSLEIFPRKTAKQFNLLRACLYNFENFRSRHSGPLVVKAGDGEILKNDRETIQEIASTAERLLNDLREFQNR